MFKLLLNRYRQGCRTISFPKGRLPVLPERYRGRPVLAGQGDGPDLGTLTFAPDDGRVYSADFRMAVSAREDLLLSEREYVLAGSKVLRDEIKSIFGRSLKLRQVSAGGCNACELDLNVLNTPVFDLSRFGIQFTASARHADGLVVTGPVTCNMREALLKTYEAMPAPKLVIAVGSCAISGGLFSGSDEIHGGVGSVLKVDLYIPGCPPHPLTILDGFLRLMGRLE